MIGCSIADCKQLIKHGIDAAHLFKWVWLTPFYVYKREKLCGRERYKAIMCGFFIIAALFMNGFTQSIKIDNDYMLVSAQNSYVQSLDNFSMFAVLETESTSPICASSIISELPP